MKFKIDENLPVECAEILKESGFEADTVYDEGLNGSQDAQIFSICFHRPGFGKKGLATP